MSTVISDSPRHPNEPAFMRGYGDWAVKGENLNPYVDPSNEYAEYELGYAEAIADDKQGEVVPPVE